MKENFNILDFKHIFFVGIGGISQSALAIICKSYGILISGSDREKSSMTDYLESIGIKVYIGHKAKNIVNVDLLVYSGAIKENNKEVVYCKNNNILTIERGEFLGYVSALYKNVIAISGIHGKTTTTAMLSNIFVVANLNPTIHIGGKSKNILSNVKIGSRDFFITEACEYRESFLHLNPTLGIILNIEAEHLDFYKNFNNILSAFNTFANNSKNVVIGEKYKSFIDKKSVLTFGVNTTKANYIAKDIRKSVDGTNFLVYKRDKFWARVGIKLYGEHNVYNALSVIAVSEFFGIDKKIIVDGLAKFEGVQRRFDIWGKVDKRTIIHDYAHHPSEIYATIKTAREYFKLPVVVFFQPHTYSRTKQLFSQFLDCFDECEKVFITSTFSAREKYNQGFSGHHLYKNLKIKKPNTEYIKNIERIPQHINKLLDNPCIILILGAGDICKIKN